MTNKWSYDSDDCKGESNTETKQRNFSRHNENSDGFRNKYSTEKSFKSIQKSKNSFDNKNPDPCSCIGIFGLSKNTLEETLVDIFKTYGNIISVNLIMDKNKNESLGFAFIKYEDIESATKAIEVANGMCVDGKDIRVDYSITQKAHTPTPGQYKGKISNRKSVDTRNRDSHYVKYYQKDDSRYRSRDNLDDHKRSQIKGQDVHHRFNDRNNCFGERENIYNDRSTRYNNRVRGISGGDKHDKNSRHYERDDRFDEREFKTDKYRRNGKFGDYSNGEINQARPNRRDRFENGDNFYQNRRNGCDNDFVRSISKERYSPVKISRERFERPKSRERINHFSRPISRERFDNNKPRSMERFDNNSCFNKRFDNNQYRPKSRERINNNPIRLQSRERFNDNSFRPKSRERINNNPNRLRNQFDNYSNRPRSREKFNNDFSRPKPQYSHSKKQKSSEIFDRERSRSPVFRRMHPQRKYS